MTPSATAFRSANGHAAFPLAPDLVRLNYFYGQLLGVQDFRTEQQYFRDKLQLLNRCLHGHGVVCGLNVKPGDESKPAPPPVATRQETDVLAALRQQAARAAPEVARSLEQLIDQLTSQSPPAGVPTTAEDGTPCPVPFKIEPGLALDREGHELLVRSAILIPDIWKMLTSDDQQAVKADLAKQRSVALHVCLCHREVPFERMRRVLPDACQGASGWECGRVRDDVCVKVTPNLPAEDDGCETCCRVGGDACEYLARIDNYRPGQALHSRQFHNEVRRPIGTYRFTRIDAVNWRQGHEYCVREANNLLREGLRIHFTREVQKRSLVPGIIDVLVVPLGPWRPVPVMSLGGEVVPQGGSDDHHATAVLFKAPPLPKEVCERLTDPCRLHIIFRSAFVLDDCCRPIDGAHIGGWVPRLEGDRYLEPSDLCGDRSGGYGPWTSASGAPGINFESWFFVHCRQEESS